MDSLIPIQHLPTTIILKNISYEGTDRDNGIVYIGVSFSTINTPSTLRFDEEERMEMADITVRVCGNWGYSYESVYQLPSQGSKCINYDCTKRKMIVKMLCQNNITKKINLLITKKLYDYYVKKIINSNS